MQAKNTPINGAKALLLGFAFKENTSDTRNTRIIDVYKELESFGLDVTVYDPLVDASATQLSYGIKMMNSAQIENYHAVVLAVPHTTILDINTRTNQSMIVYYIKGVLPKSWVDGCL
jgi:UDP-N-acetyl-D-galactosamine dehydrogenase